MTVISAVVLVGDEKNEALEGFAGILRRRNVPFERAVGIDDAVQKVVNWIDGENERREARGVELIGSISTVDFVGHATQGKFFFGGGGVLSSCSDSYGQLDALRELILEPEHAGKQTAWGLRLIGCDVSNDGFLGNRFLRDNGTVLQFALSWYLQMPVWAPRGPIFGKDFDNEDCRVPFRLLQEVSATESPKVPPRRTAAEYDAELELAFPRAASAPEVLVSEKEPVPGGFYDFDFSRAMDGSELLADAGDDGAVKIPTREKKTFRRANRIFGGRMLLVELVSGGRLAYFRRK